MAVAEVKTSRLGIWPMLTLFGILLVSLSLMSDATHNSERFGQLYSWLLLINALGFTLLFFAMHLKAMRNEVLRRRVKALTMAEVSRMRSREARSAPAE